jgi:tRNA-2-methylthio-N6-dimethylallyladenosine synthase
MGEGPRTSGGAAAAEFDPLTRAEQGPPLRTYFVETWGCQMNVLDSQYLAGILEARRLAPATESGQADLLVLNTCAVREKAVQKVLSRLGEIRQARQECGRPRVVGLCGCVAEQEGGALLARSRALDFVLGPGRIGQLAAALDAVESGRRPALTGFTPTRSIDSHLVVRSGARQFVTAIQGCDQHCTFCIVPYTRGREVSRPLAEVVEEIGRVVAGGALEVTLLGQTVNDYRCPTSGADFADLLAAACSVDGLWRLQFLTSHPRFFGDRLIDTMRRLPRLGTYLHVPFQSGSDRILKRMHRRYTRSGYLDLIAKLRDAMPSLTLSTDVIVGFPGETERDFEQTVEVVEEVGFGQLYGFVYSARPRTPAARYEGQVSRDETRDRIERLFAVQAAIQLDLNRRCIGSTVEVLVDGPAKRGEGCWQGRGDDNRVVNFSAAPGLAPGRLVLARIRGATAHGLLGECDPPVTAAGAPDYTA